MDLVSHWHKFSEPPYVIWQSSSSQVPQTCPLQLRHYHLVIRGTALAREGDRLPRLEAQITRFGWFEISESSAMVGIPGLLATRLTIIQPNSAPRDCGNATLLKVHSALQFRQPHFLIAIWLC